MASLAQTPHSSSRLFLIPSFFSSYLQLLSWPSLATTSLDFIDAIIFLVSAPDRTHEGPSCVASFSDIHTCTHRLSVSVRLVSRTRRYLYTLVVMSHTPPRYQPATARHKPTPPIPYLTIRYHPYLHLNTLHRYRFCSCLGLLRCSTYTHRPKSQPTYLILVQSPALVSIRERRLDHISLAGDRP